MAAVETGNHFNVGKLLVKGATNIEEALDYAITLKQYKVCATLLMVMGAQMDDIKLVCKLYGAPNTYHVSLLQNLQFMYIYIVHVMRLLVYCTHFDVFTYMY